MACSFRGSGSPSYSLEIQWWYLRSHRDWTDKQTWASNQVRPSIPILTLLAFLSCWNRAGDGRGCGWEVWGVGEEPVPGPPLVSGSLRPEVWSLL